MVGILVSFWDGLFSGAMLVLGSVDVFRRKNKILDPAEMVKSCRFLVDMAARKKDRPSRQVQATPGISRYFYWYLFRSSNYHYGFVYVCFESSYHHCLLSYSFIMIAIMSIVIITISTHRVIVQFCVDNYLFTGCMSGI